MPKEPTSAVVKRRSYGILFIIIAAGLIALSIAIYLRVFTSTTDVTLQADQTGNQLLKDSDVKIRGLIVGRVEDITVRGTNADVKLALEPDKAKLIPANVTAQILPKTLFGEQYVSLILPKNPEGTIEDKRTITQDRSKGALEAQTVFDHLFPVLTAVQPAELNATLTAISTALQGRGEKLGEVLSNSGKYIKAINPSTQTLVDDLDKLGKVAIEYDNVAPDLFDSLSNLQTTVRTVVEKRTQLDSLFNTGATASDTLGSFLSANKTRLINTVGQTAKIYPLLAEYSPSFSCLFQGINKLADSVNNIIYNNTIHLGVTVDATNQGKYVPGNQPKLITGYGPNCFGLPNNVQFDKNGYFQIPGRYQCVNDGAPLTTNPCAGGSSSSSSKNPSADDERVLNSSAENALVNSLVAGDLHTSAKKVPGVATMLAAPLLRGNQVSVK